MGFRVFLSLPILISFFLFFAALLCHTGPHSPIFYFPEIVKALGLGVHRAMGRTEGGQAVGEALHRNPFPQSLDAESCLQTARPSARPFCIRIRVNKAWGVRAAVCQECCKPSRGSCLELWGSRSWGRAGRVRSLVGRSPAPLEHLPSSSSSP